MDGWRLSMEEGKKVKTEFWRERAQFQSHHTKSMDYLWLDLEDEVDR